MKEWIHMMTAELRNYKSLTHLDFPMLRRRSTMLSQGTRVRWQGRSRSKRKTRDGHMQASVHVSHG
jgi:hypothetical protein